MALAEAPVIPGQQELVSAAPSHAFSDSIEAALKRAEGKAIPSKNLDIVRRRLIAFSTNAKIDPPDDETVKLYYNLQEYGLPASEIDTNNQSTTRRDISRLQAGEVRDFIHFNSEPAEEIVKGLRFGVHQLADPELYALVLGERGMVDQQQSFLRANAALFTRINSRIDGTEDGQLIRSKLLKLALAESLHTPHDLEKSIPEAPRLENPFI